MSKGCYEKAHAVPKLPGRGDVEAFFVTLECLRF